MSTRSHINRNVLASIAALVLLIIAGSFADAVWGKRDLTKSVVHREKGSGPYSIWAVGTPTPMPTATPTSTPHAGVVRLSSDAFAVSEGYTARIGVSGSQTQMGSGAIVTSSDGTAVGGTSCTTGVDYIAVNRGVYFFGFDTYQEVLIVTCPDAMRESDETVMLTLSAGGNSVVAPPFEAVLTIRADTGPPTPTPSATPSPVPSCTMSYSYSNQTPIVINDFSDPQYPAPPHFPAYPYPSTIQITEVLFITGVSVKLFGVNHTRPDDIDLMLVGPGGENVVIMSDVGRGPPVAGVDLTLDDGAFAALPEEGALAGGFFRPTNIGAGDVFPAAPVPSGGSDLSVFNGTLAAGNWSLWASDDLGNEQVGSIAGGWEIVFHVCPQMTPTPTLTPTASPTPTPTSCRPPGTLDATFAGDGKVTTPILGGFDEAESVALQADGKIVAVGESNDVYSYFSLARYNTDGSLDTTFAGDGTVSTSFNGGGDMAAHSVAIQPDGKIIAAGSSNMGQGTGHDFALVRFNPDGLPDTTFDGDGKVTTHILGTFDLARAVALQPDGKIVLAGYVSNGSNLDFALVRYNSDGSLDTTFGVDGKATTHIIGSDQGYTVAIQADLKIVVAGTSDGHFAVVRYDPDGSLDMSFDGDGKVTTPGASGEAFSVAIQPDGKIVMAGSSYNGTDRDFAVLRYNSDGSLDTTFDGDGVVTTAIGGSWDDGSSVAMQADGRIVVAGSSRSSSNYDFAVVRYNPDGTLDTTFNGDGKVTTPVLGGYDSGSSIAIQSDGGLVVAGASNNGSNRDFAVVRYNGGPCTATLAPFDYDADGRTDISVFRPSNGGWYLQRSAEGFFGMQFGIGADKIVPADYDGDGKTDVAVFRPSNQRWYIVNSADGTYRTEMFGLAGDLPAPADYDGDGKADVCVFRPSDGTWYLQKSSDGTFLAYQFGAANDKPTVGDFDGDGKSDIAVFRTTNGEWYQLHSTDGSFHGEQFGFGSDKLAYADYDGDGKTDLAVFRPADRIFYIRNSATATYSAFVFGLSDDIPTPGDYDGDGRADLSVFRPSDGNWYRLNSGDGSFDAFNFGLNGDRPTPTAFQ